MLMVGFNLIGQDYLSVSQKESFQSASSKLLKLGFELKHTIGKDGYHIFWRRNKSLGITEIPILINFDNVPGTNSNYGNELDVFVVVSEGTNKSVIFDKISNEMKSRFGSPIIYRKNELIDFGDDVSLKLIDNELYNFKVTLPNPSLSKGSHFKSGQAIKMIIDELLITENSNFQIGFKKLQEKNYSEAVRYFTYSLSLIDNVMYAYIYRGWAKALLEDKYGSMDDLNKAFELMKNIEKQENADLYYYKGLVHLFRDEVVECCKNMSKAGELGKKEAYDVIRKECK